MSDPGKTSFVNSGPFEVDAGPPTPVPSHPQLPGAVTPVPAPAPPRPTVKRSRRGLFIGLVSLLILVLLGSILGSVYWFTSGARMTPTAAQVGGHVYFISSGQISEQSSQGINDQLVIDLHNLSTPAAGKSYYAWLLSDSAQSEGTPIFITKLAVVNGNAHFFYQGDQNYTNLRTSRPAALLLTRRPGVTMLHFPKSLILWTRLIIIVCLTTCGIYLPKI
ncbi:MAG: hypothetical protein E6I32_04070 [Chloroflexi bacterium]|nr:MAG: hypothetical protein E6I32_04070 [Chloroflexota bacterium]